MTRIGVLAYDGCFAAQVFGFADLLQIANRVARQTGSTAVEPFEVSVVSASGDSVRAAGGFVIGTSLDLDDLDTLVVPGFALVPGDDVTALLSAWSAEIATIAAMARRGTEVGSVCVGAFLLGEAGVLAGREVTTGWLFATELATRYPGATVTADSLIVGDGRVTTTAAFSAVLDLALHIVRRHAGEDVARRTARLTLVADNRTSQAAYVDRSMLTPSRTGFARSVERWLLARLAEPYDLAAVSRAFNVSTRTMLRRFAAETGRTPLDFLQQARVTTAQRLLESTDARIAEVMERVGYLDPGSFRRLFTAEVGVTPATYRRQFRAAR